MFRRTLFAMLALPLALLTAACEDDGTGPDQETFVATLSGQAERPDPVTTNATGTATFTVNDNSIDFRIDVNNLTGVTGAHIHGPAGVEENAGVLVPLPLSANAGTGTVNGTIAQGTITQSDIQGGMTLDALLELIRSGQTYVNVHTAAHPAGEIRGQIQEQ
jgi:hypothetical protein